jgi:hypothetical protein
MSALTVSVCGLGLSAGSSQQACGSWISRLAMDEQEGSACDFKIYQEKAIQVRST